MSTPLVPVVIALLALIVLVGVAAAVTTALLARRRDGQHGLDLDLRARVVSLEQRVERLESRRF